MRHFPKTAIFLGLFLGVILLATAVSPRLWAAPQTSGSVDVNLLARLIRAEAEAEPYTGQVAVGAVILNRIQSPRFPNTLAGVVYQPHAFESVSNGEVNKPPTPSCQKAARDSLSGWDPSGGALFFFNPAKVGPGSYVWTRHIIQRIGKHVFAL